MPFVLSQNKSSTTPTRQNTEEGISVEAFLENMESPDAALRLRSVRSFAKHPQALGYFKDLLAIEVNREVREAIITILIAIDNKESAAILVPFLKSEDVMMRNAAVEALQNMANATKYYVTECLNDKNADVRIFTVNILQNIAHPNTLDWISSLVSQEKNINVCMTVLDALGELNSKLNKEKCSALVQEIAARFPEEPYVKFACEITLKKILAGPSKEKVS